LELSKWSRGCSNHCGGNSSATAAEKSDIGVGDAALFFSKAHRFRDWGPNTLVSTADTRGLSNNVGSQSIFG
jgi:hypothetical protein